MALTPNFDRIVATVTAADIEKFLRSSAPDDDKQRVLNASSNEIKMRLVGGYLIRTNQVTPARLNGGVVKAAPSKAKSSRKTGTSKRAVAVAGAAKSEA